MRILHIGPSGLSVRTKHGGAVQRRMLELSREQIALGHEVLVLSADAEPGLHLVRNVPTLSVRLRLRRPARDYEFFAAARQALRGREFDVLHAHGSPQASIFLNGLAKRSVQTVDFFRYAFSEPPLGRSYYRRALQRYDAVMAVSDYCEREFRAYYRGLRVPVTMVPNGVDLKQFRPESHKTAKVRSELGLPDGPLVVYLGRVCRQKGSDLLGGLARRMKAAGSTAHVVAVGPSEQFGTDNRSTLMEQLQQAGVICTGAVHEKFLRGVLNAADVVVLPTREDEMFGMAALEALACGTPVVASNLGGIPQAVGRAGRLFPVGDEDSFAELVIELLENPTERAELGLAGTAHAAQFSWAKVTQQTLQVYFSTGAT